MSKNWANYLMVFLDWLGAILAWIIFFKYRKLIEASGTHNVNIFEDPKLIQGMIIIPLAWLLIMFVIGSYDDVIRKSRLQTIYTTLIGTSLGSIGLLFTVISDDLTLEVTNYIKPFVVLFAIHLVVFLVFRLFYLSTLKYLLKKAILQFKGLLISDSSDKKSNPPYINPVATSSAHDFRKTLKESSFDTIIVDLADTNILNKIVPFLIGSSNSMAVLIHESSYDLLRQNYDATPSIRSSYVTLFTSPLSTWERKVKRIIDIIISFGALAVLSPLFLWLYLRVKTSSPGAVIYFQERIGRGGIPFNIYKFRSMYQNAEDSGPLLAQENDSRCTPFGSWMRRWRLDELPQFLNVLRGEMSLVGPRPERAYYTRQLLELNPRYALLWQVRPGITSWGQIKFGYASNIKEMMKRFRYDLLYLENMSIPLDLRILYYTLIVLIQGKGR